MVADERAMAAIYDRHHQGLLSFCRHMLGSREEAEQAVRETFQLAWPALERSEEPVDVRPWLYAIARNRCIAMLRAGAGPRHEDALHDLARLPVDERAALLLAEDGGFAPDEIARVLGVPDDQAEAMVVRARDSLIAPRRPLTDACSAVRVELARPGTGTLPRSQVRRHLRDCPRCRGYRESVRRQHAALTAPVVASAGLRAAAVGADAPRGRRRKRKAERHHLSLPSPKFALLAGLAVVAVLAAVAGVSALSSGTSTPPAKPPAASAATQKPKPKSAAVAAAPDPKPKATHRRHHRRHHHKAKASGTSAASAAPAPQPAPAPPPPVISQKPKKVKKQSTPKQQRPVQPAPKVTKQPKVDKQPKVQKTPQPDTPSNAAGGTAAPPPESGGHSGSGRSVDE